MSCFWGWVDTVSIIGIAHNSTARNTQRKRPVMAGLYAGRHDGSANWGSHRKRAGSIASSRAAAVYTTLTCALQRHHLCELFCADALKSNVAFEEQELRGSRHDERNPPRRHRGMATIQNQNMFRGL